MIEVEKMFRPSEEELKALLEDAQFIKEKVNHDIYYDYPDYRLFKESVRLRNRNGSFELKMGKSGIRIEMETREEIEKYFKTNNIEDFIRDNLIPIIDFSTKRKKYKKEGFTIAVDEIDFGYKCVEIELIVEKEEQADEAQKGIMDLARRYNFENKKAPSKRKEYFRIVKPDVYKMLYGKDST